ncbi:MAG TPA: T9SS type A sorting domain-containing protein [Bacteroidia bacterium]|nr:T9SS type A sorting domain-containing protein [Bacteroidia bacterium]
MKNRWAALILSLVGLLNSGTRSHATGFELFFGGPGTQVCSSITTGPDSSVYMLGYTDNGIIGGTDFMLAKVTINGQLLWTHYFGTPEDDNGVSLLFLPDGNLLLAGTTNDITLNGQVLLIIADTSGTEITRYTFGGTETESVRSVKRCPAPDNGFLIAGYRTASGTNYSYLLKLDSLFNEEWTGSYGAGINDYASAAIMLASGKCFVASDRRINLGGGVFDYDISLIHPDTTGMVEWDSLYHEDFQNGSQGIIASQNGHLLIYGETEIAPFSPFDYFIFATDTLGNLMWRQTFGGVGTNALFDLIEDASGDLIGTGYGNSASNGSSPINLTIVKTDAAGNLLWQREYGYSGIDIGYCIREAPDGGYLVAGRATTINDEDFYLLKVNDDGLLSSTPDLSHTESNFICYPNPAKGLLHFKAPAAITGVKIIDVTGRIVFTQQLSALKNAVVTLELPALSEGPYLLELNCNGKRAGNSLILLE